jgi:hypothetical protein
VGVVIFLVVAVPVLGFLVWTALDSSFVRIPPGRIGLVLLRGRATDRSLPPGPHWVPTLRQMMVAEYPALELSYRAGQPGDSDELEEVGPPVRALLADRLEVSVAYTVRFRIDPGSLRTVHERFGPDGLFAAVRDETDRTVRAALDTECSGVGDLFGETRARLERSIGEAVSTSLSGAGLSMTMFAFADLDLGPTAAVIQATGRARLELEREEAEAAVRLARVRNDAALQDYLAGPAAQAALRYREVDVWREVLQAMPDRTLPPTRPTQPGDLGDVGGEAGE